MNSKEALKKLFFDNKDIKVDITLNDRKVCEIYNTIKFDLDRLENLEKEHNKLKERYKHRAETSNDLCKAVKQYEKAFEILKRFNFSINETRHNNTGYEIWTDSLLEAQELTQEEYDLLKEVLGNER